MKRAFLLLLAAVVLAGGALFLARDAALEAFTDRVLAAAVREAAAEGLSVTDLRRGTASFEGFLAPVWRGTAASVDLSGRGGLPEGSVVLLTCDRIALAPGGAAGGTFRLDVTGLRGGVTGAPLPGGAEKLLLRSLASDAVRVVFEADLKKPWAVGRQLRSAADGVKRLLRSGETDLDVSLEGKAVFSYRGEDLEARFGTVEEDGARVLRANSGDLMNMAARFDLRHPLTEAEVEILSRHPLRAAHLLSIRNRARRLARDANRENRLISADAFRHIYWSYLLTEKYGDAFAAAVTNSHEEGRTGNSPAEKAMDLQNNTVGRTYARRGYELEDVATIAATDREVVARAGSP